jgi:hypothetical protein
LHDENVGHGPAPALTHEDDHMVDASFSGDSSTALQSLPFSGANEYT